MDIRLALMCGTDIPIPQCQLTLHQPKIWEIAMIGEQDFFVGIQCLTINKNMISADENVLSQINNFHIFMTVITDKDAKDKKESVLQLFSLMIPNSHIVFTPNSLVIKVGEQTSIIDENNFDLFQDAIKAIFCFNNGPMDQSNFNPSNAKAKEIADKLMRGRQRVAAQNNGDSHTSMFSQYVSSLTVGLGSMSLNDAMNLTMFQLLDLMERYSLYINWDLDIRSRLAGGKPDDKPDNWMKNIH